MILSNEILIFILSTFLFAGFVKGIIGLGLPTISLALLTIASDLSMAIVLLLAPAIATNIWQGFRGPYLSSILKRFWVFFLACGVMVPIGTNFLLSIDVSVLSCLLGTLLVCYALIDIFGISFEIKQKSEKYVGFLLGVITGLFTGMTGSCVFPGVLFLNTLQLKKEVLIQAMGMLFSITTIALAIGLHHHSILTPENMILSFSGIIPSAIGMFLGGMVRKKMSEVFFRKIFFVSLAILGVYIIFRAFPSL